MKSSRKAFATVISLERHGLLELLFQDERGELFFGKISYLYYAIRRLTLQHTNFQFTSSPESHSMELSPRLPRHCFISFWCDCKLTGNLVVKWLRVCEPSTEWFQLRTFNRIWINDDEILKSSDEAWCGGEQSEEGIIKIYAIFIRNWKKTICETKDKYWIADEGVRRRTLARNTFFRELYLSKSKTNLKRCVTSYL